MPRRWRSLAGLYGRSLAIRICDDSSRVDVFYREPIRIPTLPPRGWQGNLRVLIGLLRDLSIPVPTCSLSITQMASVTTLYAFLWLSVTWILYKSISLLYIRRQHAIKSRKLACEPAPLWPATNLGISTIKQMMAAQKAGRFPAYLREREEVLSESQNRPVHTMRLSILGNEAHFTSDPKNIQALLATQFKDFGLGSARIGNFGPLMGDGIVGFDYH